MRLILKNKEKIVSLGLLPIICTLIGLHFFSNIWVLGLGTFFSLACLVYGIIHYRTLNFFLLLGVAGIGLCFIVRSVSSYQFIPYGGITPILELLLLIVAFIHITVPEIYSNLQRQLGLNHHRSFLLETKIIVVLSGIHLTFMLLTKGIANTNMGDPTSFITYGIPILIYLLCLLINTIGIRLALSEKAISYSIRIAPICNGKIYLMPKGFSAEIKNNDAQIWDLPIESLYIQASSNIQQTAVRLLSKQIDNLPAEQPRQILKYQNTTSEEHTCQHIDLFILPLKGHEENCVPQGGAYFSFDEIKENKQMFHPSLMAEIKHLEVAAHLWQEYGD